MTNASSTFNHGHHQSFDIAAALAPLVSIWPSLSDWNAVLPSTARRAFSEALTSGNAFDRSRCSVGSAEILNKQPDGQPISVIGIFAVLFGYSGPHQKPLPDCLPKTYFHSFRRRAAST